MPDEVNSITAKKPLIEWFLRKVGAFPPPRAAGIGCLGRPQDMCMPPLIEKSEPVT